MVLEMQKLFGGSSIANRQKAVADNFRFYIWMIYGFEKDYDLVIRDTKNQELQLAIPGITSEQFQRNIKRIPQQINELYSFSIDNANKSSIVKISSFGQIESFCAFADSAFSIINKNTIENLIIDIRGNGGGRSVVVDSLMNYLTNKPYTQYRSIEIRVSQELKERYKEKYPDSYEWIGSYAIDDLVIPNMELVTPLNNKFRFNGNMFLLTDKTSYSAAATFAGLFKELQLGIIIGEETGGTIEYYGDYWDISSPNTGIAFCIAPKRFVQFGGTDFNKGVIPDYIVENDGDSIINFTYRLIEKRRNANSSL
jgi:C-terminal processing protease CtpA/Prc